MIDNRWPLLFDGQVSRDYTQWFIVDNEPTHVKGRRLFTNQYFIGWENGGIFDMRPAWMTAPLIMLVF